MIRPSLAPLRRLAALRLRPTGLSCWLREPVRHIGGMLLIAAVLSFILFALDPMAKRYEGPSVRRPWDQQDAAAGTTDVRAPIAPPWLTWEYYATFWKNRISGNIDNSIISSPSQFTRTFGTLMQEGARRRANTALLLSAALALAALAGTALGYTLRAWRRRMGWRTGFALLELLSYLPMVTLIILTLLVMVRMGGIRPDWRRLDGATWFTVWDILIFPATVLAIPLSPRIARFWLDRPLAGARALPWALRRGREALAVIADAALIALGWIAVVELAFVYPGLAEWAIRASSDVRVAQAWILFLTLVAFAAVFLGGRAALYWSAPAPGLEREPTAEPATPSWAPLAAPAEG